MILMPWNIDAEQTSYGITIHYSLSQANTAHRLTNTLLTHSGKRCSSTPMSEARVIEDGIPQHTHESHHSIIPNIARDSINDG
ncbi:MAG: hypothetical protein Q4A50_04235 [Bacteroidales bacterium]|nr:hypothetical protein [Bacteroidales bacterium]